MINQVSQTSSFYDLTKFLVFSFNVSDHKVVEDILVKRERGLLDEVQRMKICCQNLEQERDDMQKIMKLELELLKENYDKRSKKDKDLLENNLRMELELSKKNYEEELEQEKELFEKNVRMELELDLELCKENYEKELKGKQDLLENKLSLVEKGNLKVVKELRNESEKKIVLFETKLSLAAMEIMELAELRKELETKIEVFESKLSSAEMEKMELEGELRREFEKKIEVFENKLSLAAKEKMELQENIEVLERMLSLVATEKSELKELGREFEEKIEVLERKLSLVAMEKSEFEEKLRREFEEKIEVLERENRDLEKKRELRNERLGRKLALVEERLANLKAVFANVSSGNAEANRGPENDSCGRVISMSDSHNKVSNVKSYPTKTQASLGNPSSKPSPQLASEDLEGITNGDQLGVKTGGSFLEYEPVAGGYRDNSINCKRKRSIDGSEDDSDSLGDHKKTKRLLESGCRTVSLPINLSKNLNSVSPGTSKANPPPKFISESIEQHDDKNQRHENSEHYFTKSISRAVDGTNRLSRGDPHLLSPVNKVCWIESGKEIKWEHRAEMLSAFGNDPELCMAAVCALYRLTISARVSGNRGGFTSFDIVSGTSAAKYLINSDPANKLSKSVSEVQQDRPAILGTCKRLAIHYGEQLFEMYQKNLDPFFCSKP